MSTIAWPIRKLTPKGLPRPLGKLDGTLRPIPWMQDTSWGTAHAERQETGRAKSLCNVCGRVVNRGKVFVVCAPDNPGVDADEAENDTFTFDDLDYQLILDGLPLHDQCALMTRAHCKTVREMLA